MSSVFLTLFYFGHSASKVSRYDKGHTFIFLSYLYVSSISGLEVLCYYYYYYKKVFISGIRSGILRVLGTVGLC